MGIIGYRNRLRHRRAQIDGRSRFSAKGSCPIETIDAGIGQCSVPGSKPIVLSTSIEAGNRAGDPIQWQYMIDCAKAYRFFRHAEDDAASLILRDRSRTSVM